MAHAGAYRQQQIMTASAEEIVAQLYAGLVRWVGRAEAAIRADNPAAAGEANGRALDIVACLLGALDHDRGGDVARSLQTTYELWSRCLIRGLRDRDPEAFAAVRQQVQGLADAWRRAMVEAGAAGRQDHASV